MTIRTKITASYLFLTIGTIVVLSILASTQINAYLDDRSLTSLGQQTNALWSLFETGRLEVDTTGARDEELVHLARTLDLRLTLIRRDGVVVFDSDVTRDSLARLENHGRRPEVMEARTADVGIDRRHSVTLKEDLLYAAKMLTGARLGMLDSGFVRTAIRLNAIKAIDSRVQAIIWSVGLLALVVNIILSFQVSRRVTRPILKMAATAVHIRDGDLQQRIDVRSDDEFGTLARAINDLAGKLSSDIAQLRRLERVRTEFLGNVSHELRTPIFSIQGFIETLLDGAVDDPSVNREFLEKAHKHAGRLSTLLDDLIEISRIESGDMKMSFRYFDVRELINGAVEEMAENAKRKSLSLETSVDVPAGVTAFGDRERLKQALTNLIDNAIKYTDPGGRIVCGAKAVDAKIEVWVEDTGSGIAAEHIPRIFERFYRVDKDRSREVGGTGLGLAIVKHIVEAHGSAVSVESQVGSGSTFKFWLKQ
ncbi:MAG TPA: ATP-binding protein [Bacteroidota bacterium]|nr:ATP-binding protein [Bacteroidota bacterium]